MRKFCLFMAVMVMFFGLYGCEKLSPTEIQKQKIIAEELATTSRGDLIIFKDNQISVITYSDNISVSFYHALGLGHSDGVPIESVARRTKKIVRKIDEHYRDWAAKFLLQ